jgi:hypothetical protein
MKDDRCFEWMERFVRTLETRWDTLIEWYSQDLKEHKALQWVCFGALRGDEKLALQAAL